MGGGLLSRALPMAILVASCGWHTGPISVGSYRAGRVLGTTVEPGLRTVIADALVRRLAADGAVGRLEVNVSVHEVTHQPVSAVNLEGLGAAAWESSLGLRFSVEGRPTCAVRIRRTLTWTTHPDDPVGAGEARAVALAQMVAQGVTQGLDRMRGDGACR